MNGGYNAVRFQALILSVSTDVLALFDLDHTLLTVDSDEAWVEYLIEAGELDRATFERANHELVARYRAGEATSVEFTHFYLSTLVGRDTATLAAWHAEYLELKIRPAISEAARQLLDKHRRDRHLMILTTATSRFLTEPIARELGLDNLIATEPELKDERYTGRITGTPNMRDGKVIRLEIWLAERGLAIDTFRQSWFYSDSVNDLPLLSRVTHPVAVNPDPPLAALAREKGWPQIVVA
ncbi:MAG: HAD family hydrolase [Betaproteobacteria bacterium]|nr:MAG: HAD family hydrolase [Betaproteobacteria bacterium]TMH02913.1 MAG: HAD family hydrolase [Betaproteobacteria bacterium]